jgi:hypothetical protein
MYNIRVPGLPTAVLLLVGVLTMSHAARAQSMGDAQLRWGFSYAQQPRSAVAATSTEKIPSGLNVAPADRLLLDVSSDTWIWKNPKTGTATDGAGDTTFSATYKVADGEALTWKPTWKISYSARTPTSDPVVVPSNRHVMNSALLAATFAAVPGATRLSLTLKAGPTVAQRDDGGTNAAAAFEVTTKVAVGKIPATGPSNAQGTLQNTLTYSTQATGALASSMDSMSFSYKPCKPGQPPPSKACGITIGGGVKMGVTDSASKFGAFATLSYDFKLFSRGNKL